MIPCSLPHLHGTRFRRGLQQLLGACTAILRLKDDLGMLSSARPRPRDASSVCGCSSSMRLFSQLDTRKANSIPGPQLLEGASACIQCFVRRETASVRAVVGLWREDAGQGMTKTSDYCSAAPLRPCQSSEHGLSRSDCWTSDDSDHLRSTRHLQYRRREQCAHSSVTTWLIWSGSCCPVLDVCHIMETIAQVVLGPMPSRRGCC